MPAPKHKVILEGLWKSCNATFFGGKLKRLPRFHTFESRVRAGYFSPGGKRDAVGVNERYFTSLPLQDLLDTVLHELCHQEQWEAGMDIAHDEWFRERCEELGLEAV